MKITLDTAPTDFAVDPQEFRSHSRIQAHYENSHIQRLLRDAQREAEGYLHRKLITQTWIQYFDAFANPLQLRYPPLLSATSVKYLDIDGDSQTLASTYWEAAESEGFGIVRLKYGQSWPLTRAHSDSVWVEFVCGYGVSEAVPEPIKAAIRIHAAHHFRHREGEPVPSAFLDKLRPFRASQFVTSHG